MRWPLAVFLVAGAGAAAYHFTRHQGEPNSTEIDGELGGAVESDAVERFAPKPGAEISIDLIGAPATHYGHTTATDPYRDISVRAAGGSARHDANLAAAAREVAFHSAVLGTSPPESVSSFLLHSSGAPETSAARFVLHTNDDGDGVIERAIDDALSQSAGPGRLFFGVGEASTPGERHSRRVVVLTARRTFQIDSAARFAPLDSNWTMRGKLPVGFRDPIAMALYPDGKLRQVDIKTRGSTFEVTAPTGAKAGTLEVGIDGVGAEGPGKLLQLSVEVGRPLPKQMLIEIPQSDPGFDSLADAEAYAARLLAIDREREGVSTLVIDPELTDVARAHSEEMRDLGYFGHRSPRTGLAADRVRDARYRTSMTGENLAKNDSLAEAEASLLASVGHRANLLSPDFTHVGVGVAKAVERGQTQWYVTQLFAKKAEPIDAQATLDDIVDRLDRDRRAKNADSLEVSTALADVAESGAQLAAAGADDKLAEKLGREARDRSRRTVVVSVQVIYSLDQLQIGDAFVDPRMTRLGAAVFQPDGDLSGKIAVVLIAGR